MANSKSGLPISAWPELSRETSVRVCSYVKGDFMRGVGSMIMEAEQFSDLPAWRAEEARVKSRQSPKA